MNILIVDEVPISKSVVLQIKFLSAELMTKVYSPKCTYSAKSKGPRDKYGRVK